MPPRDDEGDPEGRMGCVSSCQTTTEFAEVMKVWARSVPLEEYASNPPRPKKPKLKKQSGAKINLVSTYRILKALKVSRT